MNRRSFLASAAGAIAATGFPVRAKAADLAGDMAILREAITTIHPGLYRYLSPRAAEAGLQQLEREFLAAPDMAGQYLALSRFLATIRCGHTHASFFNQSKAVEAALFDRGTRLPFGFRWLEGRMIVIADHGGGVAPGSEVLAINGVPARAMLARLIPYARADGSNDDKRRIQLSVMSADSIEYFDVFHGLLYGAPAGGTHRLNWRDPAGRRLTREVAPISLADRQAFRPKPPADGSLGWSWEMRPDGIAVLTMPDWVAYRTKWDWRGWLRDRLDSLGGAKGLIVDLRANEGGNDCGDPVLGRFLAADLPAKPEHELVRFRSTPAHLRPYLDTWDKGFHTSGEGAERHDNRFFRLPSEGDDRIAAQGPRLQILLAVLIGPQNSSATFRFAENCRRAGVGTLIGEPTGGNRRGINGGRYFFVRLPASGLEFDLPIVGYFPHQPQPDAGIVPAIRVPQTARDIATGRDRAMDVAVSRLR